jgi:hypothetical protein
LWIPVYTGIVDIGKCTDMVTRNPRLWGDVGRGCGKLGTVPRHGISETLKEAQTRE